MKRGSRWTALGLACLLSAAAPITGRAADTPSFARSEEEWARLQDNKLEYDEIPDLIHEYNVTVINNRTSYRDYLGDTRDDVTQRYRDAAAELRDNIEYPDDPTDTSYATMLMAAQMNLTQAKSLEQMADDNIDDARTVYLQYQQVEDNLVYSTKLKLIAYYQKLLANELTLQNRELLEAQYRQTVNLANVGLATETDLLNARKAVEQLDASIISDKKETQTMKQTICLAAGWAYNADPELGPLPEITEEQIASINMEEDQAKAVERNYTLLMNQRKYENSTNQADLDNLSTTMKDNRQKIASDVETKYQALLEAQSNYQLAVYEQAVEQQNTAKIERQYQLGTVTALEYQQQAYAMASRDTAAESGKLSLLTAWEDYQAAVNGLASAS